VNLLLVLSLALNIYSSWITYQNNKLIPAEGAITPEKLAEIFENIKYEQVPVNMGLFLVITPVIYLITVSNRLMK